MAMKPSVYESMLSQALRDGAVPVRIRAVRHAIYGIAGLSVQDRECEITAWRLPVKNGARYFLEGDIGYAKELTSHTLIETFENRYRVLSEVPADHREGA